VHAASLTPHARFFAFENRSNVGEFEAELIKALARETRTQGVLFDEKTEGRNSRDTVPLTSVVTHLRVYLIGESS
jgi:hypothetical protein